MIKLINVKKKYKEFLKPEKKVLENLSFEANEGKITGLIGPNGVGKSTTFKLIAGLEPYDSGQIIVNNLDLKENYKKLRGSVAILLEKHGFEKFPGRFILQETGMFMGMNNKEINEKIDELIELLNLSTFIENNASSYSRGQLGRLGIARMLMKPPKILLFDEPTVGLDFVSAKKTRDLIKLLANNGHTVLISTHIPIDIITLCNKVVGIEDGKNVDEATVKNWLTEAQLIENNLNENGKI